jgi:hypothetical protein
MSLSSLQCLSLCSDNLIIHFKSEFIKEYTQIQFLPHSKQTASQLKTIYPCIFKEEISLNCENHTKTINEVFVRNEGFLNFIAELYVVTSMLLR